MAPRKTIVDSNTRKSSSRKSAPKPIKDRKEKVQKPLKQILRGLNISFSGDFGDGWEYEKVVKWIRYHGGTYDSAVSEHTTHLICTIEDYKNKTQQVKKARALGRSCYIVTKDWLDDCLIRTKKKPKRREVETPYTLDSILKRLHQSPAKQQEYRDRFEKGVKAGNEFVDNDLWHVYYDGTGFEYKVVCHRFPEAGSTMCEKYTIYLFESLPKPCLYMVGAKYSKGRGHKAHYWREECKAKVWVDAWKDFNRFFLDKTGIHWNDRCDGLPPIEGKFTYIFPTLGRPVGALPEGKQAPKFQEQTMAEAKETDHNVTAKGLIYDTDSEGEGEGDDTETSSTPSSTPNRSFAVRAPSPTSPVSISSDSASE
ncbi:hypothetical protein D0Z07_8866 [Hyphodiscus hymeniophilus]|uniref:BRCT domain-containing protein n=1 Tax=Hyphodiscus hymeniophilus TaxID=353542 RepID=A0A9P6SQM3_9HELO|nr:hypothetical protein D0Z07_8866 [Hyphodiscus hymeniophilus]